VVEDDIAVWMIAAVARNGVIGCEGKIPWHISADLKRFRQLTTGHPVVMGRLTFASIGRPLPDRDNIVMTRSVEQVPGAEVARSVAEALALARSSPRYDPRGVAVIGGSAVYRAFLPLASRIELTIVDCSPEGDAHFPFLDPTAWDSEASDTMGEEPTYRFVTLRRRI
jgi:dihydrofolate reductase